MIPISKEERAHLAEKIHAPRKPYVLRPDGPGGNGPCEGGCLPHHEVRLPLSAEVYEVREHGFVDQSKPPLHEITLSPYPCLPCDLGVKAVVHEVGVATVPRGPAKHLPDPMIAPHRHNRESTRL